MFAIEKNGVPYGNATIERQGLYTKISCSCRSPERILLKWSGGKRDLGVCVPMGEGYGIQTRIPTKHLGFEDLHFLTQEGPPRSPAPTSYLIAEDVPFTQLKFLRMGTLVYRAGRPSFQRSISRPTGQ